MIRPGQGQPGHTPTMASRARFSTFEDFWPFYVSQHMNFACRQLHVMGTSMVYLLIGLFLATRNAKARALRLELECSAPWRASRLPLDLPLLTVPLSHARARTAASQPPPRSNAVRTPAVLAAVPARGIRVSAHERLCNCAHWTAWHARAPRCASGCGAARAPPLVAGGGSYRAGT
jgi:hypothetical protein